ncbi:hypothetical protein, partial [Serratia bockelmannii]|uniref:hypothetical protein n=1 Tax=Serratia bockelmannii TaxID=2703793 RepID=UPI003FA6F186
CLFIVAMLENQENALHTLIKMTRWISRLTWLLRLRIVFVIDFFSVDDTRGIKGSASVSIRPNPHVLHLPAYAHGLFAPLTRFLRMTHHY